MAERLALLGKVAKDARFALGVARGRPFQVLIQVTNRCNMRCGFCDFPLHGVAPAQEMTVADYRRLARELAEVGTFIVSIEGGEPTLRPDLPEIVAAFAERHLPILYTNGWYVDDALARAIVGAGVAQVGVSIDFPDAERHDARRKLAGGFERAWRAVDLFRKASPRGGRVVHVMTVLMADNRGDLPALLAQSAARGVGHCVTLVSTRGFRRGKDAELPDPELARELHELWRRHPHLRVFEQTLERMEDWLAGRPMPECRAGVLSFNVDHLGGVAPCIETIDRTVGNVRKEPLADILARLQSPPGCQECYTLCRGMAQALGDRTSPRMWRDLAQRFA